VPGPPSADWCSALPAYTTAKREAQVLHGGLTFSDLFEGMAGEIADVIKGQPDAADPTDSLGFGRLRVGHRPQVGHDHHRERHPALREQGAIGEHKPEAWQHKRWLVIE
jgi:hypothetical protein